MDSGPLHDMTGIQDRCARWTMRQHPDGVLTGRLAKLLEEAGELSRACIGKIEGRPNRGDPGDEAAQIVLVVASIIGIYFPDRDLFADVIRELERVERVQVEGHT
jgi:hypothetical protein